MDLLLRNGRVRTMNPTAPVAQAVGITGSRITAVGTEADLVAMAGPRTQVLDLAGGTAVPGLVDCHMHPLRGSDNTVGAGLTGCWTVADVLAALRDCGPVDGWMRGWGLDPDVPLDRHELDDAFGDVPTLVNLFDGHAGVVSTAALRAAGLDDSIEPAAAGVVRDATGQPTGLLLEDVTLARVAAVLPHRTNARRVADLRRTLDAMAACGLTGGHVMDLDDDDLAIYRELDDDDALALRLRLHPWCRPDDPPERIETLLAWQRQAGRMWRVTGVKLFIDGTIDLGTAWLRSPDRDGCSDASYWSDPADYRRTVHLLADAGVATVTHAIGDAAVTYALDTLAGAGRAAAPHRIEHLETLPDDQLARFAQLGVIASMQPTHATDYVRADGSDNWSQRLGPERAARGWRCADVAEAGATLALGSDWPVAHYDPRGVLSAAVTRRHTTDHDRGPVGAGQALTPVQALAGYTTAAAAAAGEASFAGRIAVGRRADLTVLAGDPVELTAADTAVTPVLATVLDGRVRHRL